MTALAKLLAVCAGTVGGAACVATGVIPAPLIDPPTNHAKPAAKVTHHRPRELAKDVTDPTASSLPEYDPAPAGEVEPQPQPRDAAQIESESKAKQEKEEAEAKARSEEKAAEREASVAATQSSPTTDNGATEYVEPAPPPPAVETSSPTSSAGTSAATSSGAPSGGDGSKGTAAGELLP